MVNKRVAILGGGMAGLTTAYELSKVGGYDISVYQMGWRLGGKAASGRDMRAGMGARNLEHGLHVWFGYYENAFRLLQEVYAAREPIPDCPIKTWTDAFKPQKHTGIGMEIAGRWRHVSVDWPIQPGYPGDGAPVSPVWGSITLITGWLTQAVRDRLDDFDDLENHNDPTDAHAADSRLFLSAARQGLQDGGHDLRRAETLAARPALSLHGLAEAAALWAKSLLDRIGDELEQHFDGVLRLLQRLEALLGRGDPDPDMLMFAEVLHIFTVTVRGAVHDLLIPNLPFEALDDLDFREWLLKHGGRPDVVANSSIVRILYDISFQYLDGDLSRPSCAAGSGLGSIARMLGTYKGSMMYHVQGGFGDVVVAPIYEHLVRAGVKFHLFHKVTGLFAGQDVKVVDRVAFDVQARPLGSAYRPTSQLGGMTVWPSEPYWDQLQDGERLARDGVNFESHWRQEPPVGQLTLEAGKDFDVLVLALTMAAYKPLNAEDGSICQDLFAHSKKFHAFATQIGIVPTIALQLWCDWSLEDLGCELGKCATVSGPQPFDIWADMSQVLDVESWPQGRRPASLHYLCGAYSTQLHHPPASDLSAPSEAFSELRSISKAWMETKAYGLWPRACAAGGFDWTALHDPAGGVGEARLDAQFWRANIDPTECCVGSEAGSTKHRLLPHESGFDNLILTGEATRHGLNGTAVEAAVMSGVAAAKAIQGQSYEDIPGFDFLMRAPWSVLLSPS